MGKNRMPKSLRKFIRFEKARIRRQVFDLKEKERLISELYQRFDKKTDIIADKKVKEGKKLAAKSIEQSAASKNDH